jgi:uncharacterized repeat protein (TIGR01451 family)
MTYTGDVGNNDLYAATITPAATGVYTYGVRFDGNWATGNPNIGWTYGDRTGLLTVLEPPSADLAVTKVAPATVLTGETFTYTIEVVNNGPDDATGVEVEDTLPAGVTFVSASAGCVEAAGVVTCDVGDLAVDETVTIEIVVTAPATAGDLVNTVDVVGIEADPDVTNNEATATTTVALPPEVDLSVTKEGPLQVTVGDPIGYMITVENNGPDAATGVVVVDTLPAGVTFVSASAGCVEAAGVVTCDVGDLAALETAMIDIVVTSPAAGNLVNNVTVAGNEADPDLANNAAFAGTTVNLATRYVYLPLMYRAP